MQLLNMLEDAEISAYISSSPEGWLAVTALPLRLVSLGCGIWTERRYGLPELLERWGHSPPLESCPAERRSLPAWHWAELWASACHSHPTSCPRAELQFCKRKESSARRGRVCPRCEPGSANSKILPAPYPVHGCIAPGVQHCPRCSHTQPKRSSTTPAKHAQPKGPSTAPGAHMKPNASVRSTLFLERHNGTKAKVSNDVGCAVETTITTTK